MFTLKQTEAIDRKQMVKTTETKELARIRTSFELSKGVHAQCLQCQVIANEFSNQLFSFEVIPSSAPDVTNNN